MQSDERLVGFVRRGNHAAFGVLVSRYESRLLSFCRHLLRSQEDAEDVLQEVFTSAFKAMLADERPIIVRPWLYRIARNRCLNHLRRITAIGVDSIEDHFSEHVPSTSEAVQQREDLWVLVGDIRELPESQRSALLLREMEALSYEQIAEVLDKTVPSVKSLLIRARRGLAEAAEARTLSCEEAMVEVGECHLGVRERPSRVVRRHLGECSRCEGLGAGVEGLAGIRVALPLAPLLVLRRVFGVHLVHSARAGSTAAGAAGAPAAAGSAAAGSAAAGFVSAGIGGLAGKTAVGLTAAALGVAGAVVVDDNPPARHRQPVSPPAARAAAAAVSAAAPTGGAPVYAPPRRKASSGSVTTTPTTSTTAATTALAAHTTSTATTKTTTASTTATAAVAPSSTVATGGAAPNAQLTPGPSGAGTTAATTPSAATTTPASTAPGATTPTAGATTTTTTASAAEPATAIATTSTSGGAAATPTG